MEEIDELKEEAEEAKKLAEEWEAKYKDMQRQMEMLDGGGGARPRGLLVQQGRGGRSGGGARAADASRARVLAPCGWNGT